MSEKLIRELESRLTARVRTNTPSALNRNLPYTQHDEIIRLLKEIKQLIKEGKGNETG